MHVAGGALIGGLGGGSAFSTLGGAAGAGLASKMAGSLNDISKGVASATGADLIGNLAANIAAGVGGAIVGGTGGSAMASNVHLYNQSVDDERPLTGDPGKKSPSLFSLAMQGIANGLSAIIGMNGGVPPAARPGVVLAESTAANAVPKAPGYVPSNATFISGNQSGNQTKPPTVDIKIADQLGKRGWTQSDIQAAIENGPTGSSIDKRSAAKSPDGIARNDTATVYGTPSGYVVVNDRTNEVVQISNKNDAGWIVDGRIKWNQGK